MRTQRTTGNSGEPTPKDGEPREKQKRLKEEAAADPVLREQTKTEVEERPYLDTEGGD